MGIIGDGVQELGSSRQSSGRVEEVDLRPFEIWLNSTASRGRLREIHGECLSFYEQTSL